MPRSTKLPITINNRFLACLRVAVIATSASCGIRAGNVTLIPVAFEGWVVIRYQVPGAPSLDREGARTMVKVPASGSLSTSSDSPYGYGIDEYYLVGTDGERVRIQGEADGCNGQGTACIQHYEFTSSPIKATTVFVGKKQNLPRYPKPTVP